MTTFTWKIHQLETRLGPPQQNIIHWDCTGELNGVTGRVYNTCYLPVGDDVPPLSELTEQLILDLCWEGELDKEATEQLIQNQIEQQINTSLGLPIDAEKTHEDFRLAAFAKIDAIHADIMTKQTGNKTQAEISSWPTKSAAARFVHETSDEELEAAIALTASGHLEGNEDLMVIINNVGTDITDVRAHAAKITPKSMAYKGLIGLADRMRDEAKAAVLVATAPEVPLEDVSEALDAVEAQILAAVQAKLTEWREATNG